MTDDASGLRSPSSRVGLSQQRAALQPVTSLGQRGEKWEKVGNWTQGEKRGRVSGVLSASLPLMAPLDPPLWTPLETLRDASKRTLCPLWTPLTRFSPANLKLCWLTLVVMFPRVSRQHEGRRARI
eukprot:1180994-Prorocentrum_minimum.AAC.5